MAEERETQQAVTLDAPFEHLASKEDVANMRTEIAELRGESSTQIAGVHTEIERVRTEIAELRGESNTQIGGVRTDLKTEIATVRTELKDEIASTRSELKDAIATVDKNVESIRSEMRTMKWMMGIVVAAVLVQLLERFFV